MLQQRDPQTTGTLIPGSSGLSSPFAPGLLCDAESLQHRLRSQKPGGNRDRSYAMWSQFCRHVERQPFERELHSLSHRITSGAEYVVLCHFDNEASAVANQVWSRIDRKSVV